MLRTLSESKTLASRKLGSRAAAVFHARLADLRAARKLSEFPFEVSLMALPAHFSIELADGFFAVFSSNHAKDLDTQSPNLDFAKVNRIKLMEVTKRNG